MTRLIREHLGYANVMSTLAVFLAIGGGAYAARGTLFTSSGDVRGCVNHTGGTLSLIRAHSRCKRGSVTVMLATPTSSGVKGATGPEGATGPRGQEGPQGPGAYAFSMGPTNSGPQQTIAASFAGNQMRLACGAEKCKAEVLISQASSALGFEAQGWGRSETTSLVYNPTAADATIAKIESHNSESYGNVTVSLANGSAWQLHVELLEEGLGNVTLTGTAVPASATVAAGLCEFPCCC